MSESHPLFFPVSIDVLAYRMEAKLALPLGSAAKSITADSIVRYDLFETSDDNRLVPMGYKAMCFYDEPDVTALYNFQPHLMAVENEAKANKSVKKCRSPGEAQLTMTVTSELHHRRALPLASPLNDDAKIPSSDVVYGLLQEGKFVHLYVAYMEGENTVYFFFFLISLELTLMKDHA